MHKLCNLITGILIVVFALWETVYSKWILVILGVLLILHPLIYKGSCCQNTETSKGKPTVNSIPKKPIKKK